jgi:hypothetical protein
MHRAARVVTRTQNGIGAKASLSASRRASVTASSMRSRSLASVRSARCIRGASPGLLEAKRIQPRDLGVMRSDPERPCTEQQQVSGSGAVRCCRVEREVSLKATRTARGSSRKLA